MMGSSFRSCSAVCVFHLNSVTVRPKLKVSLTYLLHYGSCQYVCSTDNSQVQPTTHRPVIVTLLCPDSEFVNTQQISDWNGALLKWTWLLSPCIEWKSHTWTAARIAFINCPNGWNYGASNAKLCNLLHTGPIPYLSNLTARSQLLWFVRSPHHLVPLNSHLGENRVSQPPTRYAEWIFSPHWSTSQSSARCSPQRPSSRHSIERVGGFKLISKSKIITSLQMIKVANFSNDFAW
jgi:hypothetical protein